ncbi:MAG: bifunctional chorismate mutase/prephenate dehydratase [Oscillospiraceae bacterium]
MDLNELRCEIDKLDSQILDIFEKRMELCKQVAVYKKENNMPVMQGNREQQIIDNVKKKSPEYLEEGAAALFFSIMDISKSLQQYEIYKNIPFRKSTPFKPQNAKNIICQGVEGANSEEAAVKLFGDDKNIIFCSDFNDVFNAVENNEADFGVLPILNSTAGSVTQTYDLMKKHSFYINSSVDIEICHCLAVKKGTAKEDITAVYSHPHALSQCSEFIRKNDFKTVSYINTATSARYVSESDECIAAICSERCAALYGLEIIERNIADTYPNYTKFICISKDFIRPDDADTVSVMITLPHKTGSLYRLLEKFFVSGLNLKKIESRPIADGSFNVVFYMDFEGNVDNEKVSSLITEMCDTYEDFRFLGNFKKIK